MFPLPQTAQTIPWTALPPADPNEALAAEWETYRRESGDCVLVGLDVPLITCRFLDGPRREFTLGL